MEEKKSVFKWQMKVNDGQNALFLKCLLVILKELLHFEDWIKIGLIIIYQFINKTVKLLFETMFLKFLVC